MIRRSGGFAAGVALGVVLGWVARASAADPDPSGTLERVLQDIGNRYPEPPDRGALLYAAIHGLMAPLDRWSRFYAPAEVSTLTADPPDLGIGVSTAAADCGLTILTVEGVASTAGLRVGDCILAVDGAVLAGLPVEQRAARLLGTSRSASVLQVQRGGRNELVPVRRDWRGGAPLLVQAPRTGVTWLTVHSFPVGLTDLWPRAGAHESVVVDLRGNPGGELSEAVRFVDRFASEGTIVQAVVRGEPPKDYLAHADGDEIIGRVAVLVDEGTASAAEITAAALRERAHAVVIGRPTVGKRAIETIIRYEDGSAMQLTIGRFEVAGGSIPIDVPMAVGAPEDAWRTAAMGVVSG